MSPYYLSAAPPPSFYIYSQVIVLCHSYIYHFGVCVCVIIYG